MQDEGGVIVGVRNGFLAHYGSNGYRDVKLDVLLENHACEVQLHFPSFYDLRDGQHKVYEWSRRLNVTVEMRPDHLFKDTSKAILARMISLARGDWCSTRETLPALLHAAGEYDQSAELLRRVSVL